jgi:hypothetical protein
MAYVSAYLLQAIRSTREYVESYTEYRFQKSIASAEVTCPFDPIPFLRCSMISTGSNLVVSW